MIRDECILLDDDDNIIGHCNKKDSHIFSPEQVTLMFHMG
jgi:isopentenyldiphosphate isomerase